MTKTNGDERVGLYLPPHFKIRYAADNSPGYQEKHDAVRRYRQRIAPWLTDGGDRMPMRRRLWFRISEIADVCAQIPDSVQLDEGKLERAIELLRKAILTGEFEDTDGRSTVANLHPAFAAELRFARESASQRSYFRPWISYLWIKRADCEAWFRCNRIEFPKDWVASPAVTAAEPDLITSRQQEGFQTGRLKDALKKIYPQGRLPPTEVAPDAVIASELNALIHNEKWKRPPNRKTIMRLLTTLRSDKSDL
jgi:hypothetical protein